MDIEKAHLKCKGFKDLLHVYFICFIIGVDKFLMILLTFYWSKLTIWFCLITLGGSFFIRRLQIRGAYDKFPDFFHTGF